MAHINCWMSHTACFTICICNDNNFHMSRDVRKPVFGGFRPSPTQIRLRRLRKWLEAWNFVFRKKRDYTILVAKTKALISFAVTVFVFAYAKIRFSHVAAHRISVYLNQRTIGPVNAHLILAPKRLQRNWLKQNLCQWPTHWSSMTLTSSIHM